MMTGSTIVYTLRTCNACRQLREDWSNEGILYEERQVDDNQVWLDEARKLGDQVPIIVYPDGRIEVGYKNMIS